MAIDYTTIALLARVIRTAAIPSDAPGFTNDELLAILNDELQATVAPWLMEFGAEYLVDYSDTLITAGKEFYPISTKAIGSVLRSVKIVRKDSDDEESDDEYVNLTQQTVAMVTRSRNYNGFVLRGDRIQLLNSGSYVGQYLRQYYFRQPNMLVETADARVIATVGAASFTVANVPSAWGATPKVDLIQGKPQFRILSEDQSATVSGGTITMTIPSDLVAGDWVALAGETPVPQIPYQVFPLLAQAAAVKCLETYPDAGGLNAGKEKLRQLESSLAGLFRSRVDGDPVKINRIRTPLDYC